MHKLFKYLSVTSERGIGYTPKPELGIQCYVGADFAGGWNKADMDNPKNVMSRIGKLQMEIALSTDKAEYIDLSSAMRE
eukprot:15072299-Ditylum_brightwellii.AAC.1